MRQLDGGRGGSTFAVSDSTPLTARLCEPVNRVAGKRLRLNFGLEIQTSRLTRSAIGATARAHVCAVSDRRAVSEDMSRQLPFLCSKNHSRRKASFVIQF